MAVVTQTISFYRTSIGKKFLMALSGLVWFGFLAAHLYSNLHIYGGPKVMNDYYEGLESSPLLFWGVRVVLLSSILIHIVSAFQLVQRNRMARAKGYRIHKTAATTYAARTMALSGPILLLYIIYHLLHLTVGVAMPAGAPHIEDDVYHNIVRSFSVPYVSAAYLLAFGAVGIHLYHGAWSFFQSLGLNHSKYNAYKRIFAAAVTLVIVGGYVSIPVAVLAGWLK